MLAEPFKEGLQKRQVLRRGGAHDQNVIQINEQDW